VELLLDSGADIDMRNNREMSPFDLARENGKHDVAIFLARRSGDISGLNIVSEAGSQESLPNEIAAQHMDGGKSSDDEESDLLHSSSANGRIDVVRRLLDRGADVNARNELLQTPLDVASRHGELAIAKTLIEYGADVNSRDFVGWTPLHTAARNRHVDIVELLLYKGADIHATEREGYTALHIASANGFLEIVRSLLVRGANVRIRDVYGLTPSELERALQSGDQEIARLLSEYDVGG
jgi:ankyrin repeat protein